MPSREATPGGNNSPSFLQFQFFDLTGDGFTETGRYGMRAERISPYSALMLAARITLPHFAISSAISFPKSAGEPASALPPDWAIRALVLGSARAALISRLSLSMISAGVPGGPPRPNQTLAS